MDTILIDIDNNTPGAIISAVFEFIRPKCPRGLDPRGDLCLVNKYFNKTIRRISVDCNRVKIFDRCMCKTHSPDYDDLFVIHEQIIKAKKNFASVKDNWMEGGGDEYIHFETKELADKAVEYVEEHFVIGHRCCRGKGMLLRSHSIV